MVTTIYAELIEDWGFLQFTGMVITYPDSLKIFFFMGIPLTGVASTYIIPLDGGLSQNLK